MAHNQKDSQEQMVEAHKQLDQTVRLLGQAIENRGADLEADYADEIIQSHSEDIIQLGERLQEASGNEDGE